ncbi:MAG: DUF2460 domain-containing protein [Rickettsiales bacterium]|nr:DUF2460 domain-containing protein [Rickettsiales bacterium]
MGFVEVRFPDDISYGSSGGPSYSTDIVINHSGYENRNSNWSNPLAVYNVIHAVKTQTQLDELIHFFRARKGRAVGFRFKDWSDYQASGAVIGHGDGSTTDFQFVKTYSSGGVTVQRSITKPVDSSYSIFIDSVLQNDVTDYTLDVTTGIVSFMVPPVNGAIISADFEFDVPVRFDTDTISVSLDNYGIHSIESLPLVEIRV